MGGALLLWVFIHVILIPIIFFILDD